MAKNIVVASKPAPAVVARANGKAPPVIAKPASRVKKAKALVANSWSTSFIARGILADDFLTRGAAAVDNATAMSGEALQAELHRLGDSKILGALGTIRTDTLATLKALHLLQMKRFYS